MTSEEARAWVDKQYGGSAVDQLDSYARELTDESERQNLIAPSTLGSLWVRHLLDSAQLVPLAPAEGLWIDIGTGAGLPGIVVAVLRQQPTMLVEPRRRRADFLVHCAGKLGLDHVEVRACKIATVAEPAAVISARAVAPVEKLLQDGAACSTTSTRWLLPRGASGATEAAALQGRWRGMFHMKQSLTDPQSVILICDGPIRR